MPPSTHRQADQQTLVLSDAAAAAAGQDEIATAAPGEMIDHFRVMRRLGSGGMGEVFLARDTLLGRKVAIKLMRRRLLERATTHEQFLNEARTTAKFSHPNIVQIHAVGEHNGAPYVALEYIEGETLGARLDVEVLSVRETIRLMATVALAVQEAHRHGVLHRDLKPENIIIARDGRPRILDFGLAIPRPEHTDAQPPKETATGTPAYMAPEQWLQLTSSEATDVWAMGVMLYELLSDQLPFPADTMVELARAVCGHDEAPPLDALDEVTPKLAELVAHCLRKDPSERPSAAVVSYALQNMLALGLDAGEVSEESCPFRGLLAFTQQHARLFHGREADVAALVERIRLEPMLTLVGASGAGKSSLVHAGVVPRLCEQGRWLVLSLRPGSQPFRALARRLDRQRTSLGHSRSEQPSAGAETELLDALAARLAHSPHALGLSLRQLAEERGCRVLLVVDQLEELYTLVADELLRARFLQAVTLAADDAAEPVRVVSTLRDDFLGRLASSAGAGDAFSHVAVVKALSDDVLREVLVKPLQLAGYRYEDDELPQQMIAEVAGEPACLPLLSFAARKLWDSRDSEQRLLTRRSYEAMGGVAGALAQHADGLLDGLSPDELEVARRLLLMLVTPERTRRRLTRAHALAAVGGSGSEDEGEAPPDRTLQLVDAEAVLARLTDGRLITVSRGRERGDATLELTHESLVHTWATLSRWLDQTKDELVFLAELEQAAALWSKRGRSADELWRARALAEAKRMQRRVGARMSHGAQAFLGASEAAAEALAARRRRLRLGVTVVSLLTAALAVVVALYVWDKEQEARQQAALAEQRRAQALHEGALAAYRQGHLPEARAKLRTALEIEDSPSARVLWWRLSASGRLWRYDLKRSIAEADWAPDGQHLAIGASDGSIRVLDAETLSSRLLRASGEEVLALRYAPSGELVAGDHKGDVTLWDRQGVTRHLKGHRAGVLDASFDRAGERLATGGIDRKMIVWNVSSGEKIVSLDAPTPVPSVSLAPNGQRVAWCLMNGEVVVWDLNRKSQVRRHRAHAGSCYRIIYSHDGRHYATGGTDQLVKIWSADSGELEHALSGHRENVTGLGFSADDAWLASGSWDSDVRVWDVNSGELRQLIAQHDSGVPQVAFAPADRRLLSASSDGTLQLHRISDSAERPRTAPHRADVNAIAFAQDDRSLVSCDNDGRLVQWHVLNGDPERSAQLHDGACNNLAVSSDDQLATAGSDNRVKLWSLADGELQHDLSGHRSLVSAIAFSPSGDTLTSGGADGVVRHWNPRRGEPLGVLSKGTAYNTSLAFFPDGESLLVAGRSPQLHLLDSNSGALQSTLAGGTAVYLRALPSPDGKRVAATTLANALHLFDLSADGDAPVIIETDSPTMGLAWHPDSSLLAFGTGGGSIGLLPISDGEQPAAALKWLRGVHHGSVKAIAITGDGTRLASTDERSVRLWDLQTRMLLWRAPVLSRENQLWSHHGWIALDDSSEAADAPNWSAAMQRAMERSARYVDEAKAHACMLTLDHKIELWPRGAEAAAAVATGKRITAAVASEDGCLFLDAGKARLLDASGAAKALADSGVTAIAYQQQHTLLALERDVELTAAGTLRRIPHGGDVTALGLVQGGDTPLVGIGYRNGAVELAQPDNAPRVPLEHAPASTPLRILAGPSGTLFVGFANGAAGLWSLAGKRLWLDHLHGPVVHARLAAQRLFIATDLGAYRVWDLRHFYAPRCELLRAVWATVPIAWQNGQPIRTAPPAEHPCQAR